VPAGRHGDPEGEEKDREIRGWEVREIGK